MVERLKDVLCGSGAEEKGMGRQEAAAMSQEWQLRLSPTAHQIPIRPQTSTFFHNLLSNPHVSNQNLFFISNSPKETFLFSIPAYFTNPLSPSPAPRQALGANLFLGPGLPFTCQDNSILSHDLFPLLFPKPFPPAPPSWPSVHTAVYLLGWAQSSWKESAIRPGAGGEMLEHLGSQQVFEGDTLPLSRSPVVITKSRRWEGVVQHQSQDRGKSAWFGYVICQRDEQQICPEPRTLS